MKKDNFLHCEVDFFTTENTEVTEIELLLWRLQEETMASTIRPKASAQRANAIVFIAQPIWEVPWHLLINALFHHYSSVSSVFSVFQPHRS